MSSNITGRRLAAAGTAAAMGVLLCALGNGVAAGDVKSTKPAAVSKPKEFDGFGKAKFGMPPAEVERLYPSARKLDKENLGASVIFSPLVARHLLIEQAIQGLKKPVRAELRYWKERLWVVIVYWGDNDWDDVKAFLSARLGDPPAAIKEPFWRGAKTTVTTELRSRWYAIADNAISKEAQDFVREDLQKADDLRRQRLAPAAP